MRSTLYTTDPVVGLKMTIYDVRARNGSAGLGRRPARRFREGDSELLGGTTGGAFAYLHI